VSIPEPLVRRLAAEGLGTGMLVATVVGSGIMAERLAGGNEALALLCNTIPTAAILVVIVAIFAPLSGAHFNPAVSIVFAIRRDLSAGDLAPYIVAQCAGAILGAVVAHLMFDLAPLAIGDHGRNGPSQWLSEVVATFALVTAILGGIRYAPQAVPWLVGLVIAAAYWFTASTSFANPAVTLARGFTTTFSGIALGDVPGFVVAEIVGALIALATAGYLFARASDDQFPSA
jgi:glycerol uptake facilitator-like aquaporin